MTIFVERRFGHVFGQYLEDEIIAFLTVVLAKSYTRHTHHGHNKNGVSRCVKQQNRITFVKALGYVATYY